MAVRSLEQARQLWRDIVHPPAAISKKPTFAGRSGGTTPEPVQAAANESKLRPE